MLEYLPDPPAAQRLGRLRERHQRPQRPPRGEALRLAVHLAEVDSKGVVHFADDYYGHDAKLEQALAGGYPYPRKG